MPPAGNACFRLHTAMKRLKIDSNVLNIQSSIKRNNVYCLKQKRLYSIATRIYRHYIYKWNRKKLKPSSYFYSSLPKFGPSLHNSNLVKESDVIYFHWIAGCCLQLSEIEKIASTGKLIIFFLHDMWDFTGGCHHSFDCKGYETGCQTCPMFIKDNHTSAEQIDRKKSLFSKYSNIIFISPSEWMANVAKKSYPLQKSRVFVVPNIVDETIFKPIDKTLAKSILNLPRDKKILTFGCQSGTANKFKGWDYLQKAVRLLKENNVHVVIYGSDYSEETQNQIQYPITFLGPIYDETKLAIICNATDVFVSPSLAESFGLTFLENILCGTPVVGFNNTAIGEIVRTGETGYLAKNKDPEDLARGIALLLNDRNENSNKLSYSTKSIIEEHLRIIKSNYQ